MCGLYWTYVNVRVCLFVQCCQGVSVCSCLAIGDGLRRKCSSLSRVRNCWHMNICLPSALECNWEGIVALSREGFLTCFLSCHLSGAPDFPRGAQPDTFNENLMFLFVWVSIMHSRQQDFRADPPGSWMLSSKLPGVRPNFLQCHM